MNSLDKIFYSIRTFKSDKMKVDSTNELINHLSDYKDHSIFILKNIYLLLTSEIYLDRICGAKILQSLNLFKYEFDFTFSDLNLNSSSVYLQSKNIKDLDGDLDISEVKEDFTNIESQIEAASGAVKNTQSKSTRQTNEKLNCKKLKTEEMKEIEKFSDFFDAIYSNLLNSDWNKRHGAFMAYSAIVASQNLQFDFNLDLRIKNFTSKKMESDLTEITISGDIFDKIFEILKNDKFDDFEDDVTSSPVREAACILLKYIYSSTNNRTLIDQSLIFKKITSLLKSSNWQEQFSALLAFSQIKSYFTHDGIENLCQLLIEHLECLDEDVKFLCADLLTYILINFSVDQKLVIEIKNKCWDQLENDLDHSKAAILNLIKTIHSKFNIDLPAPLSPIYSFYTSPISIVRNSALEFSKSFESHEFLYLLSEGILFETTGNYKQVDILRDKIDNLGDNLSLVKYFDHFYKIISQSVHTPYNETDFLCNDDTFFTNDGIKSIGPMEILNNRTCLFSELVRIKMDPVINKDDSLVFSTEPMSILAETFKFCYSAFHLQSKITNIESADLKEIISKNLANDFKKFKSLKKMPIKEFLKIIQDFTFLSLFPLAYDNCLELVRKYASELIFSLDDFTFYFQLENSSLFLTFFCNILKNSDKIDLIASKLIDLLINSEKELCRIQSEKPQPIPKKASKANKVRAGKAPQAKKVAKKPAKPIPEEGKLYIEIVHEQIIRNVQVFFKVIGPSFVNFSSFQLLLKNSDRLIFFKYNAANYLELDQIKPVFIDAIEKKNVPVLKALIINIDVDCIFINFMLDKFDLYLVFNLIDLIDPSLAILLLKPMLKSINIDFLPKDMCTCGKSISSCGCKSSYQNVRSIISRIICCLHFDINENIKDQKLINLINQESQEGQLSSDPRIIDIISEPSE